MAYAPEDRLLDLCRALEEIDHAGEGNRCALRFTARSGAIAELRVGPGRVIVTTRSAGLESSAGDSEIVDRLGVDLTRGYVWDDVHCESADELAGLLLKHLYRRVEDADPEPRIAR